MGFQSLRTVFGSSITDPALLNALLMTLNFAIDRDPANMKYLTYRGNALWHINERLQETSRSVSSATIGAILMLIGVEVRYSHCSHNITGLSTSGTIRIERKCRATFEGHFSNARAL